MYRIEIKRSAEKDMRRLPRGTLERIRAAILSLRDEPRPPGVRKLRDANLEGWRIRIGDYRVVFQFDDNQNIVTTFRVRHRRDV